MKYFFSFCLILLSFSYSQAGSSCGGTGGTDNFPAGPSTPPPSCLNSQPAGNTCETAVPICDLNGYCGSTADTYTDDYWCELGEAFCGLSIENNSFLTFVAASNSISFDIWLTSSSLGYGVQLMVFSMTGNCSGDITSYACWNIEDVPVGSTTITASGLTPGNTYYIMIDGNAGDVVNYVIAANTGILLPLDLDVNNVTLCTGETTTVTASGGNGTYSWNASPHLSTTTGATVTITPPGPGTYNYTVNSSGGNPMCPADLSETVTVTVNPCGCNVTATNTGPVCPGGTINLNATLIPGATYSWTGPSGFTSALQNPTGITVPSTPGTYTYTVTANDGIQNCIGTTTVTVHPLPPVIAGANQAVCDGASVTLTATGADTYVWTGGITNGVAFIPTQTTTYTVTGTDLNGCVNTSSTTITVGTTPNVSAGGDISICAGQSVTLTAVGAATYSWNNGVTNGVAFSPVSTTTYTVTGTSAQGCTDTDDIVVTVNPLPVANAGADQSVCAGNPVTLNGLGGTPSWNNGVSNGVAFVPPTTTTYTLTVTDANGCQSTDQVLVTVNVGSVINAGPDVTVCEGTQIVLAATGGTAYSWTNGVTNNVPFIPPVGTTTYTATDQDPFGCSGIDQVTVTVNPNPIVNAGNDTLICEGVSVTLTGSGANSYTWDNGVVNAVPFTPLTSGTYTVTGTSQFGCIGTDQVVVNVTPTPLPSLTPDVLIACVPGTFTFTNTTSAPLNTFTWDMGDGNTYSGQGPTIHTYENTGCFDITLTSTTPNGCVGTITYPSLVCVVPNPIAEFTVDPNNLDLLNSTAEMVNTSQGAVSYSWNFGDGSGINTTANPEHEFPGLEPGSYEVMLIAVSSYGCVDTAYQNVIVRDALIYYVPNAFTPDGDEFNQDFKPVFTSGFDPFSYHLTIYNRWGERVFESFDLEYGWNGTYGNVREIVQDGIYTWTIHFKLSENDARRQIQGHVNVIK